MDCTQIDRYLDAMMDGALDADDVKAVESHCLGCAACAEKLKVNRQMMRVFAEMAPEMDVPLAAQAAWRGAVKREANRTRRRRVFRYAGAVAAALVVAIVATFALKPPSRENAGIMFAVESAEDYVASEAALIEADGAAEIEFNAQSKAVGAPMHEIDMIVDDVDRACEYVLDLATEYEGIADVQRYDEDGVACANLYIDLPALNAEEFIEAIRPFDKSGLPIEAFAVDADGELSILLVLSSR